MDVADFCRQSRVLLVAGKGGVGKTTVSAVLARAAALSGMSVLVVELEGKAGLGAAFGRPEPLTYDEVTLLDGPGRVAARRLTPDEALLEYLADHGLGRVSRRLTASGTLDVVATAAPGIRDILVLGKVKQLERSGDYDLVLVDAPAAGHTLTFLTSASGFADAVRVGPVRVQADDVIDLLTDPARCRVLMVTLAEETPVNEVVETAFTLEDRVGVSLGPVVVNGLYPLVPHLARALEALRPAGGTAPPGLVELAGAADFRLHRQDLQRAQVDRLRATLPLPQLHLPFAFSDSVGPAEAQELAGSLRAAIGDLPSP